MPRPLPISTSFAEGVSLIMLRIDSFNLFGLNKVRVTLLHVRVPTFLFLCFLFIWYLSVVCVCYWDVDHYSSMTKTCIRPVEIAEHWTGNRHTVLELAMHCLRSAENPQ